MKSRISRHVVSFVSFASLSALAAIVGCGAQPNERASTSTTSETSSTSAAPATRTPRAYEPASAVALPNADCKLHSQGDESSDSVLAIVTGADGVARFHAVRATESSPIQRLALDCVDTNGEAATYAIDLTSDATFVERPFDVAAAPGIDRPALAGDPMAYTASELIQAGYGLRPDPAKSATAYARWLDAATRPGRRLQVQHPSTALARPEAARPEAVTPQTAPNWVGAALTGSASYDEIQATFNVPTAIPGGDGTGVSSVTIWNGLGGFNTAGGLIQGGAGIATTSSAAAYSVFREYCCGDPDSNGYKTSFTPKPGDTLYSQQWYCDANGNVSLNGNYGCSLVEDESTSPVAVFSCTSPTDPNCWSVSALSNFTLGNSADFVIELEVQPAFTDFSPAVTMTGEAHSSANDTWQTVTSDPSVSLLTDFTSSVTDMVVGFPSSDSVSFQVVPSNTLPVVGWLSQTVGGFAGGTQVTIEGAGFSTVANATQISFGGVAATGVSCSSSRKCVATSPSYFSGSGSSAVTAQVTVTVAGQTSAFSSQAAFTYVPAPGCSATRDCEDTMYVECTAFASPIQQSGPVAPQTSAGENIYAVSPGTYSVCDTYASGVGSVCQSIAAPAAPYCPPPSPIQPRCKAPTVPCNGKCIPAGSFCAK